MENNNPQVQEAPQMQQTPVNTGVSFPSVSGEPKKSGGGRAILVVVTLILVAVLGFVIFKVAGKSDGSQVESTPIEGITNDGGNYTPEPSESSTPKAIVRTGVDIEIQNGTGTSGDAAYLEKELKALGYTSIETGNAKDQTGTVTKVSFAKSLAQEVSEEITKKLKELYKSVEVVTTSSMTSDVLVVTGLKVGSTVKPSATATPKSTASATPTASPTPTASSL